MISIIVDIDPKGIECSYCPFKEQENYLAEAFCRLFQECLNKVDSINYNEALRCSDCLLAEARLKGT